MAIIVIPNDGITATLNGTRLRDLAEGDTITITYPNPQTGRVNSETGVSIHERSDAFVADIVINVQMYSDTDVFLNQLMSTNPLTIVEGSIKARFMKDGEMLNETFTVQAASFTDKFEKTANRQDGSAVMTYTLQSRETKRVL